MSAAGNDNTNDNLNDIIFAMKNTKLYVPIVTLSARDNQKLSKLSKGFERSFIGMSIKQKVRIKVWQMNIDIFWNQTLLEWIDYLFSLFKSRYQC